MSWRFWMGGLFWLLATTAGVRADKPSHPVVLTEDATTATLENGLVSARINKANGNLLSLKYHGVEALSKGGGYWNLYGNIPGQAKTEQKPTPAGFRISHDPSKNDGALGEVVLSFPYRSQPKAVPLDLEIRYSLHRGDSGLYGWTIADHDPKYPPFNIVAGTMCLKLNPDVFDFLSVDSRRQRQMVRPEDWVQGQQLNLWEARRINTGIHKGEVEHKYDYAAMLSRTPAYGWSSSKQKVGIWIVNPSIEYINGSPTMIELTGHIDVKAKLPADPTLLFIWHGPHYGGRGIQIKANERWRKVVGPFLLYCNGGQSPEVLWKDAMSRAEQEKKAWPYAWAEAPGYEHAAQRGSVNGRLVVKDPQAPKATASGAWVGLAHVPYEATFDKGEPITIDWQTDGKHYQYWARADAEGRFTIPNARPGTYTLYAFTNGVLGDFSRAEVRVEAGKTNALGDLTWVPVRYGKQLWEIGVPDRSAAEFRHGDHYWQWGLYHLYPKEFPHGVDYVIGKSDWKRDWNYAQPPIPDGKGGWKKSTWRIRFHRNEAEKGTATLRLAICGARGGPVEVSVNGRSIGSTGELPESGVMHRDGIRGVEIERNLSFDASLLKAGENVLELTKQARTWTDGVLYDYLRLEADSKKPFASSPVGLTLPHVFGDHMVLQAGQAVPIWGWSKPGEKITVRFGDQAKQATAVDGDGRWEVRLDPLTASARPAELTIAGAETLTFKDVLVGEVWLCSGQSNMGKPVGEWRGQKPTLHHEEELRAADFSSIRLLQPRIARRAAPERDFDPRHREGEYPSGGWIACSPASLEELKFSAVGYFFGRKLHRELKVPIGLINCSCGGSRIESWTPPAGFAAVPALAEFAKGCQTPGTKVEGADLCTLYNGMIAPLVPLALRGVIWYQGETNVYAGNGSIYADKITALVKGWRGAWHRELPFYYVQLAPLLYHVTRSHLVVSPETLPQLWEAQTTCLQLPRTGMVVTTDLVDDLTDIHPRDKKNVGERLARWALAKDYERKEVEVSGPLFRSMKIEGNKAILQFNHIGGGLVSKDKKPLTWFVLAGADGTFYPGLATIDGDTVVVTSPKVSAPTVVRFAWDEAARPNFYNKAGLPAVPFRTDNPFTQLRRQSPSDHDGEKKP